MTPQDQRLAADPATPAGPEFSSAGTEVPATHGEASATAPIEPAQTETVPTEPAQTETVPPEPPQAETVPTEAARPESPPAEPAQAEAVPQSSDVQPLADELFSAADPSGLRSRWDDIQAAFVDDPAECVQKADGLVEEVITQLTTGFADARSRLEAQWARGESASTEDLRLALTRYREFFQRLLAV
jgi:hypothetical protein